MTPLPVLPFRVGEGWDIHILVPGRALMLGGVQVPHSMGLMGHSDADALLHAITDALFGAVGLGDIGRHFPDTDPTFKGADSAVLLGEAMKRVRAAGYELGNLDATVIAQAPKLAPHIPAMCERIAAVLGRAAPTFGWAAAQACECECTVSVCVRVMRRGWTRTCAHKCRRQRCASRPRRPSLPAAECPSARWNRSGRRPGPVRARADTGSPSGTPRRAGRRRRWPPAILPCRRGHEFSAARPAGRNACGPTWGGRRRGPRPRFRSTHRRARDPDNWSRR